MQRGRLVRLIVVAGVGALVVGVACGPSVTTGVGGGPSIGGGAAAGDGGVAAATVALPDGDYACALTSQGTTFPSYLCRVATVAGATRLVKLEGSHRVRGTINADAADRVGFHGEFYCAGGGCERPLETSFARGGDGAWTGDLGAGDLLRLEPRPDGMYAGAGYGADAWADDGSGGADGGAVTAWVAVSIDRTVPAGAQLPDPATSPLAPVALLGDVTTTRARGDLAQEVAGLETQLASLPRSSIDRPRLMMGIAASYRELRAAALADLASAIDATARAALVQTVHAAAVGEARHLSMRLDQYPKWCATIDAADPARSSGCGDEALWLLGRAREAQGDVAAAREAYLQLLQSWPQSSHVGATYFALGERFLVEAAADPTKLALARQAFSEVLKGPPPANRLWGAAQARLARVAWRVGDYALALSAAKKAVEFGQQYASLPGAAALAAATRIDLVALFALTAAPRAAHDFLAPLAGGVGEVAPMIRRLRSYYVGAQRSRELAELDEALRQRGEPGACARGVERVALAGFGPGVAKDVAQADALGLLALARAPAADDPAAPGCVADALAVVTALAMAWDAEAVGVVGGAGGTGDRATRALAAALYVELGAGFTDAQFATATFPRLAPADRPTRAAIAARGAVLAAARD